MWMRRWFATTTSMWTHGCAGSTSRRCARPHWRRDSNSVKVTRKIVEQAYAEGDCVIVGRGAQCILQHKPDVYHVFVYAPLRERIVRLRTRLEPGANVEQRIRTVDAERAKYMQEYFGKSWCNHHLYDLMISSHGDETRTAHAIHYAMSGQAGTGVRDQGSGVRG